MTSLPSLSIELSGTVANLLHSYKPIPLTRGEITKICEKYTTERIFPTKSGENNSNRGTFSIEQPTL